jgi:hypothetical protein
MNENASIALQNDSALLGRQNALTVTTVCHVLSSVKRNLAIPAILGSDARGPEAVSRPFCGIQGYRINTSLRYCTQSCTFPMA